MPRTKRDTIYSSTLYLQGQEGLRSVLIERKNQIQRDTPGKLDSSILTRIAEMWCDLSLSFSLNKKRVRHPRNPFADPCPKVLFTINRPS